MPQSRRRSTFGTASLASATAQPQLQHLAPQQNRTAAALTLHALQHSSAPVLALVWLTPLQDSFSAAGRPLASAVRARAVALARAARMPLSVRAQALRLIAIRRPTLTANVSPPVRRCRVDSAYCQRTSSSPPHHFSASAARPGGCAPTHRARIQPQHTRTLATATIAPALHPLCQSSASAATPSRITLPPAHQRADAPRQH